MKWTALLAVVAALLAVGPASAATTAIKGTVVAKNGRTETLVLARTKGPAVTVHASTRRVRLGDRVSVVGKRVSILSHVRQTGVRGVVLKRVAGGFRVASGRSVLTIHTNQRAPSSRGGGMRAGTSGEFEVEIEHDDLVFVSLDREIGEDIEVTGAVVDSSTTQLTIGVGGQSLAFAAPSGTQLPVLATGQVVEVRGVTINGVLTVSRIHTEDGADGDGGHGGGGDDGGGHH